MKKSKFTINIDKKIIDKDLMEYCLNLKCSGYDPTLLWAFYSLGKGWHLNKLSFFLNKLTEIETKEKGK